MISNCGSDENGKYSGGAAGDQTGREWQIIPWYNRPWNVVLRYPDQSIGDDLAYLARAAANNNLIGYDQNQRGTYWQHLKASNYDPAQITIKCEADCSSGVAANVKAVGYRKGIKSLQNVSSDCYTGNLRSALKKAGFKELTASKYLTSDKYLLPGDILLYEGHHTATNLDTGSGIVITKKPEKSLVGMKKMEDGGFIWGIPVNLFETPGIKMEINGTGLMGLGLWSRTLGINTMETGTIWERMGRWLRGFSPWMGSGTILTRTGRWQQNLLR